MESMLGPLIFPILIACSILSAILQLHGHVELSFSSNAHNKGMEGVGKQHHHFCLYQCVALFHHLCVYAFTDSWFPFFMAIKLVLLGALSILNLYFFKKASIRSFHFLILVCLVSCTSSKWIRWDYLRKNISTFL